MLIGLAVAGGLIALLFLVAAMKPNAFRVERSATISAPPEKLHALLNDFHNWPGWSPWEKLDPAMQRTHSGAPAGKGAIYEWEGNKKVGKGRMEIIDSAAPSKVVIDLHFMKPFEARNTTEFTVVPTGGATQITWAMSGSSPFMMKVMGVFMSMDKMIGKDFEAGLANLKGLAEK